jgi:hypothetical protein
MEPSGIAARPTTVLIDTVLGWAALPVVLSGVLGPPVPMPEVEPVEPPPVPIPMITPVSPGPVPMPELVVPTGPDPRWRVVLRDR